MDLRDLLNQLRQERDSLETAISDLERLQRVRSPAQGAPRPRGATAGNHNGNSNHTPSAPPSRKN
jgi:hypothetical protein